MRLDRMMLLTGAFALLACGDDDTATDTAPDATDATDSAAPDGTETAAPDATDATDSGEPDAPDSADGGDVAPTASFTCLGDDPAYPTGTGQIEYDVRVVDYVTGAPLAGVGGKFCRRVDPGCDQPILSVISDDEGIAHISVPAGFDGFIVAEGGGVMPSIEVVDPPIVRAPAESPTELTLASEAQIEAIAALFGTTVEAGMGQLVVSAHDCDLVPVAGATFVVENADGEPEDDFVIGYLAGALPDPAATATDATGIAGIFNLPPGNHTVRALTPDGETYGRGAALMRPGTLTRISIVPQQTTPDLACGDTVELFDGVEGEVALPIRVRSFASRLPIAGAHVKVCQNGDGDCVAPLAEGDTDGDGIVRASFAFGARGFDGFFEVTDDDLFPTRLVLTPPLTVGTDAPLTPILVEVLANDEIALFAEIAGASVEPGAAQLAALVTDCKGRDAHGMSVGVEPATAATKAIYLADGLPAPASGATDESGIAGIFNVPVGGLVVVTASHDGQPIGSTTFRPEADYLYQIGIVPSAHVTAEAGVTGYVQVFEDFVGAGFYANSEIVRFSNAECVLWLRSQFEPLVAAGELTLDGPFVGTEGASDAAISATADCSGFILYGGPTYGRSDLHAVDVTFDGAGALPDLPTQTLYPSAAETIEILSPLPVEFSITQESTAPLELTWVAPVTPSPDQSITFAFNFYGPTPQQPTGELHCAFPVGDGIGVIPTNVLMEAALRMGSTVSGNVSILAGGRSEHSATGVSYVTEVARGADSTSTGFGFSGTLLSNLVPPPEVPPEPIDIPEPSGPEAAEQADCVRVIGGPGRDSLGGLDVAADGTIVVAGSFVATTVFGDVGGEVALTAAGDIDAYVAAYDGACDLKWARRAGGTQADIASSVSAASDGGVYVSGFFSGSATFGPGEANETTLEAAGVYDLFLARYSAAGALEWVRVVTGDDAEYPQGLAASDGGVYLTGQIRNGATIGDVVVPPGIGYGIAFLARWSAAGDFEWARIGGDGQSNDVDFFDVEASGERAIVTGNHRFALRFGEGEPTETLIDPGCDVDAFIAVYEADGDLAAVEPFGAEAFDTPIDVAVDAAGNWLVTGITTDAISFGADPVIEVTRPGGITFVARYGPDGDVLGAWAAGGPHFSTVAQEVAPTSDGGFVIGGFFGAFEGPGYATFGDASTPQHAVLVSAGGNDMFVARYSADGQLVWAKSAGSSSGNDFLAGVVVAPDGSIVVAGSFDDAPSFDGLPTAGHGDADAFFTIYRAPP